jgi:hypothetical protein
MRVLGRPIVLITREEYELLRVWKRPVDVRKETNHG